MQPPRPGPSRLHVDSALASPGQRELRPFSAPRSLESMRYAIQLGRCIVFDTIADSRCMQLRNSDSR